MIITVDPTSGTPPYEQLRVQVRDAVTSGALAAGAKLPTVRGLAEELGLAVNTVARAYRELEADGVIETRGRNGTFIAQHGDPTQQQAQDAARQFAERVRRLGLPEDAALALVRAALRT